MLRVHGERLGVLKNVEQSKDSRLLKGKGRKALHGHCVGTRPEVRGLDTPRRPAGLTKIIFA